MYDKARIRQTKLQMRKVLLEDWDPIGIGKEPNAQDEYDMYLGSLYMLLLEKASEDAIAARLLWIETERMGVVGHPEVALAVANLLRCIPI